MDPAQGGSNPPTGVPPLIRTAGAAPPTSGVPAQEAQEKVLPNTPSQPPASSLLPDTAMSEASIHNPTTTTTTITTTTTVAHPPQQQQPQPTQSSTQPPQQQLPTSTAAPGNGVNVTPSSSGTLGSLGVGGVSGGVSGNGVSLTPSTTQSLGSLGAGASGGVSGNGVNRTPSTAGTLGSLGVGASGGVSGNGVNPTPSTTSSLGSLGGLGGSGRPAATSGNGVNLTPSAPATTATTATTTPSTGSVPTLLVSRNGVNLTPSRPATTATTSAASLPAAAAVPQLLSARNGVNNTPSGSASADGSGGNFTPPAPRPPQEGSTTTTSMSGVTIRSPDPKHQPSGVTLKFSSPAAPTEDADVTMEGDDDGPPPELRNFTVTHQSIVLEVDVARQHVDGVTELIIWPQSRDLHSIRLNSRQAAIESVTVNGVPARFDCDDYLEDFVGDGGGSVDARDVETYDYNYMEALKWSDAGELSVSIPEGVQISERSLDSDTDMDDADDVAVSGGGLRTPSKPKGGSAPHTPQTPKTPKATYRYNPLRVRVHYTLTQPSSGLHFVYPLDDVDPDMPPAVYTDSQPRATRLWVPCVDTLGESATLDMILTLPETFMVVGSGSLTYKTTDDVAHTTTWHYCVDEPVAAHAYGFVASPLEMHVLPPTADAHLLAFCRAGRGDELLHTCRSTHGIERFYADYLGADLPLRDYNQVFLCDAYADVCSFAGCTVFSTHLLFPESVIDQAEKTMRTLALGAAWQWFGVFIGAHKREDAWLLAGLSYYLSLMFVRQVYGMNVFRYNLYRELNELVEKDEHKEPLYGARRDTAHNGLVKPLLMRKAGYVFYMLERRVGQEKLRACLQKIVRRCLRDPSERHLSTEAVLDFITRETGVDLGVFANTWIYNGGCPKFTCGYWYNKKRASTEFVLRQENATAEHKYIGPLTVRIHEFDGTFDHIVNVSDVFHVWEFPCQSKHRKARKKKITLDTGEEVEVDVNKCVDSPILWIRLDPDCDFVHDITFQQNDYMWVYQLQLDRDVIAQCEAVRQLAKISSLTALTALNYVLTDARVFYSVRIEAGLAMTRNARRETDWFGLDKVVEFFMDNFFDKTLGQVRPNDFSDMVLYELQKALPAGVASVVDLRGNTPEDVFDFVIGLLKHNDNATNPMGDNFYLAAIIAGLSSMHVSSGEQWNELLDQITRYLNRERILPTYHNELACACLRALCDFQLAGGVLDYSDTFLKHLDYGNFESVRVAAFECLLRTKAKSAAEVRQLVDIVVEEPIPHVRMLFTAAAAAIAPSFRDNIMDVSEANRDLVEYLWGLMTDSTYDERQRGAWRALYISIYGKIGEPAPLDRAASKNVMRFKVTKPTPSVSMLNSVVRQRVPRPSTNNDNTVSGGWLSSDPEEEPILFRITRNSMASHRPYLTARAVKGRSLARARYAEFTGGPISIVRFAGPGELTILTPHRTKTHGIHRPPRVDKKTLKKLARKTRKNKKSKSRGSSRAIERAEDGSRKLAPTITLMGGEGGVGGEPQAKRARLSGEPDEYSYSEESEEEADVAPAAKKSSARRSSTASSGPKKLFGPAAAPVIEKSAHAPAKPKRLALVPSWALSTPVGGAGGLRDARASVRAPPPTRHAEAVGSGASVQPGSNQPAALPGYTPPTAGNTAASEAASASVQSTQSSQSSQSSAVSVKAEPPQYGSHESEQPRTALEEQLAKLQEIQREQVALLAAHAAGGGGGSSDDSSSSDSEPSKSVRFADSKKKKSKKKKDKKKKKKKKKEKEKKKKAKAKAKAAKEAAAKPKSAPLVLKLRPPPEPVDVDDGDDDEYGEDYDYDYDDFGEEEESDGGVAGSAAESKPIMFKLKLGGSFVN